MTPHTPPQHKAAIPIHHYTKIVVVTVYLNVSDITGTYLINLIDFLILKQIGLFFCSRIRCTGVAMRIERAQTELFLDSLAFFRSYLYAISPLQQNRHAAST